MGSPYSWEQSTWIFTCRTSEQPLGSSDVLAHPCFHQGAGIMCLTWCCTRVRSKVSPHMATSGVAGKCLVFFFSLKKFRVNSLETLEILPLEPLKLFSRAACTRRREAAVLSMQHSFPKAGGWAGDLLLCTEQAELSPRWGEHGPHRPREWGW